MFVSATRLPLCEHFHFHLSERYCARDQLGAYLQHKDLGLPDQALALVTFEERRNVLDADLAVVGVHVLVLAVAQENEHEAIRIRVIILSG